MENYEIIKYENDEISLNVRFSPEEKTIWLTQDEISKLFKVNRTKISRNISKIYEEDVLKTGATCAKSEQVQLEGNRKVRRKIQLYNLDIIIAIGNRIKSDNGMFLKEWFDSYISTKNANIIVFDNGNIRLDVKIEPEKETVWLTVNQMASLFDTTIFNVYMHIKNLYQEGELDSSVYKKSLNTDPVLKKSFTTETPVTDESSATQKEIIRVAANGKSYLTSLYNLDVILAVGYRVKNKRAIEFRKWASSVLKQYLLKGYAIDSNRTLITKENYLNLCEEVNSLKLEVKDLRKQIEIFNPNEKVLVEHQIYTAFLYINALLRSAENQIIIVDGYLNDSVLEFFLNVRREIKITLITHNAHRFTKCVMDRFKREFINTTILESNTFHDRFVIVDETVYSLGCSLNTLGKKLTTIKPLENTNANDIVANILKQKKTDH